MYKEGLASEVHGDAFYSDQVSISDQHQREKQSEADKCSNDLKFIVGKKY